MSYRRCAISIRSRRLLIQRHRAIRRHGRKASTIHSVSVDLVKPHYADSSSSLVHSPKLCCIRVGRVIGVRTSQAVRHYDVLSCRPVVRRCLVGTAHGRAAINVSGSQDLRQMSLTPATMDHHAAINRLAPQRAGGREGSASNRPLQQEPALSVGGWSSGTFGLQAAVEVRFEPDRALAGPASGPHQGSGQRCNWDRGRYSPREFARTGKVR
jgi:hypothetical protein